MGVRHGVIALALGRTLCGNLHLLRRLVGFCRTSGASLNCCLHLLPGLILACAFSAPSKHSWFAHTSNTLYKWCNPTLLVFSHAGSSALFPYISPMFPLLPFSCPLLFEAWHRPAPALLEGSCLMPAMYSYHVVSAQHLSASPCASRREEVTCSGATSATSADRHA